MLRFKILLLTGVFAALTACDSEQENSSSVSMANPASVYCVEQGGDPQVEQTKEGEVGYCHFSDGRVIEQWEFYHASLD
ncbi:DUF333 domain-containing protein [Agarivorans sp. Toyoura001]|uniref:putative hemolysin n=1 Tax=unclassified Agarivorans TaxID=2636026 RepID=UPI0010EDE2A4|nr:DUF333 domain-containing protein [Agarivorans sp. Toyoura001]GDY24969.1 hypothetical protein AHAT_08590 [Agarivorans sp. Toyoura001]